MYFMRYKFIYFLISSLLVLTSIFSLWQHGLNPAIDFTGGSLLEFEINSEQDKPISETAIREVLEDSVELYSVQVTGNNSLIIRSKPLDQNQKSMLIAGLKKEFPQVQEKRFESVGPTIGLELLRETSTAIIIASFLIMLYVAYRFREIKYGVCAILAMFHDSLILLGSFSLLGQVLGVEVDTLFVTAVLTTLSFSVHDTIVVYDRIRESIKRHPDTDYEQIVNISVNETLVRSLNNSLTIIFMLVALALLGGVTIRWFVVALLIGTIAGTYSSTFTAAPLLVVWENFKKRKQ